MSDGIKMLIGVLAAIAVVGGGIYFFEKRSGAPSGGTPQNTSTSTPGYTIEEIPVNATVPDYTRTVRFAPGTSDAVKEAVRLNIEELSARLKKSTLDFDAWLSLGAVYKVAGDYVAARDVWEYAGYLSPSNYPSFANLGDLYHNYLKDYPQAEMNYKRALANEPKFIGGYRALYELYAYAYPGKAALAPQVLLDGLSKNPGNSDLLILLARHYKAAGDKAKAARYYEEAISAAKKAGNTALAADLQAELDQLK